MGAVVLREGQKSVLITGQVLSRASLGNDTLHAWRHRPCDRRGVPRKRFESSSAATVRRPQAQLTNAPTTGLFVIASARRPEVLKDLAAKGIATVQLDVTNADSIAACKEEVSKLTGDKLDFLVNNAGRTHTVPATDLDVDEIRATFETNVFGVMAMCKAFVTLLISARGLIINIASLSAAVPYVFGASYCASKGAVVSYSRCLRQELRPFGVRVTVVMAGTVRSNIANNVLPLVPGSLYEPVADLYARRQVYSQTNNTMDTGAFARQVVGNALRPEVPLLLRAWFGRRDWFWCGGMSTIVWLGTILGEWLSDSGAWRTFGLQRLKDIVDARRKQAVADAKTK